MTTALVFVAGNASSSTLKFEHVMDIGTAGTEPGQFTYVEDFAFTADGKLLATDAAHAFVQVFDKTTGKYISRFGGKGDDDKNLDKPEGISVDPAGNIFVADYNTGDVKVYDKNYQWLRSFSEYGSDPGENIKSEFTDIYEGKYYMPEAGNHRVSVWDLDGNFLFLFGSLGTEPGQMNNPEASKFNSKGELVVSDLKNNRIQFFTKDGKFIRTFGKEGSAPGELIANAGIGIDKDDNIYVGEIGNNRVQVFDTNGKLLAGWGKKGSGAGEFGNIHGVIVDKATGWVYIADTANNRIQVYKPVN
tara:strand:+ start:330 stop:1238 length:909 start_codon:yes stop_codon:yes gene_type:complete